MDSKTWKKLLHENKLNEKEENADEAYKNKVKEIDHVMKILHQRLKKQHEDQKKDSGNWGFVGNLSYVIEQLQDIVHFLRKYK